MSESDVKAQELQTAIQAKLPPGFTTHEPKITLDGWFHLRFDYCDRQKYLAMALGAEPLKKLVRTIVDQIEITPMLEYPPEETIPAIMRTGGFHA